VYSILRSFPFLDTIILKFYRIIIFNKKMVSTYTATLERKITEIFEHLEADPKRALKVV